MVVANNKNISKKEKGDLPRSMRPLIPEPKHRVAPKGVSSGISFRNLPSPSLHTIKKICEHYESKCSGQYNSLASRYVLQMGQEIRSQIEGMQGTRKTEHFTFDEMLFDNLDKIYSEEGDGENEKNYHRSSSKNAPYDSIHPPPPKQKSSIHFLERQIKKLQASLTEKKTELRIQRENVARQIKNCEQEYKEKIQVDRLHFENSQRLLKHKHEEDLKKAKKEIAQVKSDARLVIDFIRRKANEAIAEENSKTERQKKSIGKKMQALESEMKKTFHSHLQNLEEEVKMVVRKEKKEIDLTIMPPPPPKHISLKPKHKLNISPIRACCGDISIPTDESEAPDMCSDDSISTCYSDESPIVSNDEKETCGSDQHKLLKSRVQELEQWTDTLTIALRNGAKIKGSNLSPTQKAKNAKFSVRPKKSHKEQWVTKSPSSASLSYWKL